MSVFENSFTSERDSPSRVTRHSLNLDLQQLGVKFDHDVLDTSKPDTQSEEGQPKSIISPNQNNNNRLENQPELQPENKSSQSIDGAPDINQQDNSSPKTITLIEDELISKSSLNVTSKFSQYSMQVENESFATFLSIKDTSYDTVVKSFEVLFENVSNLFGQRVKHISQTYLQFIRIKYDQEKAYSLVNLGHIQNSKNHVIYINCKTTAEQIRNNIDTQRAKKKLYVKALQQIKNKLQKNIQTVSSQAKQKRNKIKQIHNKIVQIGNEMNDLMISQNRKAKKNQINPQIYSNSFIRTKYLMGKQRSYLSLIASFLEKILNFISFICLDLQPKNCLLIKQSMLSFVQAQCSINPEVRESLTAKIQILGKTNCYGEVYKEVSKMLQLCVPSSISHHNFHSDQKQYGEKQLKKIIQGLISQSQSLVYIPVIQLQNKDYAYHSKNKANVRWVRVNHDQKYKAETIQQLQTYVIITHQGHLVLQLLEDENKGQQKMAILRLNQIKISRKNNQLILTDRGKGMLGYLFATNAVLGSLIFEPLPACGSGTIQATQNTLIQEFVERVKDVLEMKKDKKAQRKDPGK